MWHGTMGDGTIGHGRWVKVKLRTRDICKAKSNSNWWPFLVTMIIIIIIMIHQRCWLQKMQQHRAIKIIAGNICQQIYIYTTYFQSVHVLQLYWFKKEEQVVFFEATWPIISTVNNFPKSQSFRVVLRPWSL